VERKVRYRHLRTVVLFMENILAGVIVLAVVASAADVYGLFLNLIRTPAPQAYTELEAFLAHVLLMVVGLELALMLIRHTPGSVIEVMLYAVARKMLLYTTRAYEIAVGVAALAGLFAIRRFLFVSRMEELEGYVLSAATPVKDVNRIVGVHIPEDLAKTIGGVVAELAGEAPINRYDTFKIADAEIEVLAVEGGVVEKVRIVDLSHKHRRDVG